MKFKYWKFICIPIILGLSTFFHNLYTWFPNNIISWFSPINECIWEHNKIIFSSYLIITILEKIYYKKQKNIIFNGFISMLFSSLFVMIIFTPIYFYILNYKDNMFITIFIFTISIILSQFLNYNLFLKKYNKNLEIIGVFFWILALITISILTYHPLPLNIFKDFS